MTNTNNTTRTAAESAEYTRKVAQFEFDWAIKAGAEFFGDTEWLLESALEEIQRLKAEYLKAAERELAISQWGNGAEDQIARMISHLTTSLLGNLRVDIAMKYAQDIASGRAVIKAANEIGAAE